MNVKAVEVIMDQICVAFGQGTGPMEVSGAAAMALKAYYGVALTEEVVQQWDGVAAQALERVRAAGRLAALQATSRAASAIGAEEALHAAHVVSSTSYTPICPKDPPPPPPGCEELMNQDTLLALAFIAFGQGTGPVRVSRAGASVLRSHYTARTDLVSAAWEKVAVQTLERVRAMGRMAARLATGRGATAVSGEDVLAATTTVDRSAAIQRETAFEEELDLAEALVGVR
jgi:hypothetical protein